MGYCHLTQEERYATAAWHASGKSFRWIAQELRRSASSLSREYRRNRCVYDGKYRAEKAHARAVSRRHKSRRGSQFSLEEMSAVDELLCRKWSPEQVSFELEHSGKVRISARTIYRRLHWDKANGGQMWRHMRGMPKRWRKRYRSPDSRGVVRGKRMIDERPAVVQARRQRGHWEADTVMGKDGRYCILTLVERVSGFVVIKKLRARSKEEVNRAMMFVMAEHRRRIRTITFDNGTEFHGYLELERRYGIKCYFAHPYHAWERGSNENTNGLIRQYLPKGMCMKELTQPQCDEIAEELNVRPRKRHGFKTPKRVYYRPTR